MTTLPHPMFDDDHAPRTRLRELVAGHAIQFTPALRPLFDDLIERGTPAAPGVTFEDARVGGVPGWWARPATPRPHAAILYLHGGAYVIGTARAHRNFGGQLALRAGAPVFIADYRLAPEHPFPAAFDDALAVYAGLVTAGYTSIAITGASAGGGLALALLAEVSAAPASIRPRAAAVWSPWTDLAMASPSMTTRAAADPLLAKDSLAAAARLYLGAHDARDPHASPIAGALVGLPPVRIDVGDDEVLLDDAARYGDRCATAEVHVWAGMAHVFAASIGQFRAADAALDAAGAFLRAQLA